MSGQELQIVFGNSKASVSTMGSALVSLTLEGNDVIPEPSKPHHPYHSVMLAPWPNRITKGKYRFGQQDYQLETNEDFGNALHGLLFDKKARVKEQQENHLVLVSDIEPTAGYPFSVQVEISFTLSADGLSVETSATNNSSVSCPIGMGTHPFFVFDEESTLEVFAKEAAIHGEDMLPIRSVASSEVGFGSGVRRSIEKLPLDVQFAQTQAVCAILRTKDWAVEIFQERADWLMVYTTQEYNWADGRHRAVAIEPQTCAADAFNNNQGLVILEPNQTKSFVWGARLAAS